MTDKELILEMFSRMDDNFKEQHKIQVMNMLKMYPCVILETID
jgi:hypothetical protein